MLISLQINNYYLVCEMPYILVAITSAILTIKNLKKMKEILKND